MRKQCSQGFTIIETLIAVSLFGIVSVGALNIFTSSIALQRSVLLNQRLESDMSLVLESLSRVIREAQRDDAGDCIELGLNFQEVTVDDNPGLPALQFINGVGLCQNIIFEVATNRIVQQVSSNKTNASLGSGRYLTSGDIAVEVFEFVLYGEEGPIISGDLIQPRVTLYIEAVPANFPVGDPPPRIRLQTTISQRNLDN